MELWLSTLFKNNTLHVTLPENLSTYISTVYQQQIEYLFHQFPDADDVVVNMENTSLIDSTGISFLFSFYKIASSRGCSIKIINSDPQIKRVIRLARLDTLIAVE